MTGCCRRRRRAWWNGYRRWRFGRIGKELPHIYAAYPTALDVDALAAEAASLAVSYASPSQFNREFKRLLGLPPAAEVARMRRSFALPPAPVDAVYVSSH